ncbi:hypothetical protein AN216_05070, partial [Streptomyces oceani]
MDTRTSRTPDSGIGPGAASGGTPPGFTEDASVLSTVRVPSDPAQVVVNHVSFRVELPTPAPRNRLLDAASRSYADARAGNSGGRPASTGASVRRRRPPLVWSGHIGPEDTGARRLLRAARTPVVEREGLDGPEELDQPQRDVATQTLPRVIERAPGAAGPP